MALQQQQKLEEELELLRAQLEGKDRGLESLQQALVERTERAAQQAEKKDQALQELRAQAAAAEHSRNEQHAQSAGLAAKVAGLEQALQVSVPPCLPPSLHVHLLRPLVPKRKGKSRGSQMMGRAGETSQTQATREERC